MIAVSIVQKNGRGLSQSGRGRKNFRAQLDIGPTQPSTSSYAYAIFLTLKSEVFFYGYRVIINWQ